MTDRNNQSNETNPAFVADLLEKLRRQMAGEDVTETTDDAADTPVEMPVQAEDASVEESTLFAAASTVTEGSTTLSVTDEDTAEVAADMPVPDGVLPMYADGMSEETVSLDATEAEETDSVPTPSIDAEDTIADSVVGDQYAMRFAEPIYEGEEVPTETSPDVRAPYAYTIVPESGRISERARHPVDERYRNLFEDTPDTVAPTPDPDQYTMQLDAVAAPELPVPDDTPSEPVATAAAEPIEEITSTEEPPFADPLSVWDIPMAPLEAFAEEAPADVQPPTTEMPSIAPLLPSEDEEVPAFHATPRAKRATYADVDFDAERNTDVLHDKVLAEPLESLGGEHAEAQTEKWQQELSRRRRSAVIRSIVAGAIVFLLAMFELIRPMTDWVLGALLITRVPGVVMLLDIQLLIIVCLIGYRPLYRGLAALRFRRVIPETLASFAAIGCIISGVVFYLAGAPDRYLFALTGALAVLAAILADFFRADSLLHTYRAYVAPYAHFGGVLTHARDHRLIQTLYSSEMNPVLMETAPVSQVDGYVAAARQRVEGKYASLVSLCIAFAAALADLVVMLLLQRGAAFSFWSAMITFAAVLPLSLFALHRYLSRMLTSRIAVERIGVTGERAVYRYASCGVMSFSDIEAFPNGSVQVKGIKLCADFRLDKALYLVSSLFDRVGGPLNGVFRISTADVRISDDVVLGTLAPEGIEALVNREEVCVGTRAYLESVGIEIFRDIEDERAEQEGSRVLYVAYRGVLCSKFYVKYEISAAFEKNVEYYAKHGVSSVIVTADPLMNDALLDSISYISDYDVRFVKHDLSSVEEERDIPREVELISFGPRKTLRRMPFFFKKYVSLQRVARVLTMVGLGVCAVAVPLLLAVVPVKTALFAFLFQLLALLPTAIIGIVVRRMNPNP